MTAKLEAFAKKIAGIVIPGITVSDINRMDIRVEGSATVHNSGRTQFDWWCVEKDQALMWQCVSIKRKKPPGGGF